MIAGDHAERCSARSLGAVSPSVTNFGTGSVYDFSESEFSVAARSDVALRSVTDIQPWKCRSPVSYLHVKDKRIPRLDVWDFTNCRFQS